MSKYEFYEHRILTEKGIMNNKASFNRGLTCGALNMLELFIENDLVLTLEERNKLHDLIEDVKTLVFIYEEE